MKPTPKRRVNALACPVCGRPQTSHAECPSCGASNVMFVEALREVLGLRPLDMLHGVRR